MADPKNIPGDAGAIIAAVERLSSPEIKTVVVPALGATEVPFVAYPEGYKIGSIKTMLDEWRDKPDRIRASPTLLTVDSFTDYLNRFKRPDSAVFVSDNPSAPKMVGFIDYHGKGAAADPSFNTHQAIYSFPLSDPMKAWLAASKGGLMGQAEFATFLQDRFYDIENPPLDWMGVDKAEVDLILNLLNLHDDKGRLDDDAEAARYEGGEEGDDRYIPRSALYKLRKIRFGSADRLLSLSRNIEIAVNQKAQESYSPKTGERVVHFSEEHQTTTGGVKVVVPDGFFVNIPVFEAGERHLLPVRLAYRKVNGTPKWSVNLIDGQRLIRLAIAKAAEVVENETGLPVMYGEQRA